MPSPDWVLAPADDAAAARLARDVGIARLTARLLWVRGVRGAAEARRFLRPALEDLPDPRALPDMERALKRVDAALKGGEKIGIYGDYDVDGLCGAALLARFLRLLDVAPEVYIPERMEEGYGIHERGLKVLADRGVRLLLTVDTGTVAHEAVRRARELGMDVVVLDHHVPDAERPEVHALVNPLAGDPAGFEGLAGSGVALQLVLALARGMERCTRLSGPFAQTAVHCMALAAVGTVADVCPLRGANRIIVAYGLDALRAAPAEGMRALLKKARVDDQPIEPRDVSFRIAPRLNAAGRLGSAGDALELLLCDDKARGEELAEVLEKANRRRKEIEDDVFDAARAQAAGIDLGRDPAIVLADEGWHPGVVGIVAAHLVDEFHCPVVLVAFDRDPGRGSARGPEGFNIKEAFDACAEATVSCGGHARAGGLVVRRDRLDEFRGRFLGEVRKQIGAGARAAVLGIEAEAHLEELTPAVVVEIERLGPFGVGNARPVLSAGPVQIAGQPKRMGKGEHVSFFAAQGETSIRAVGFGMGDRWDDLLAHTECRIAFSPHLNRYMGREEAELLLKDVRF